MKSGMRIVCILFSVMMFASFSLAQEDLSQTDEFCIELLYKHFESHYTPRDLLLKAQKEAMSISEECRKGEEPCKKIIDEFNYPHTRWNNVNGFEPNSHIHDFDKGWVEAHPNPELHKIRFIENLVQKFKDHAGRLCILEGFNKLPDQPEGIWIFQYTTWIKAKTKIATPLYALNVFVKIPGTRYHVSSLMPYRAYSLKEMDKTVEYLDSMVEFWSIIE